VGKGERDIAKIKGKGNRGRRTGNGQTLINPLKWGEKKDRKNGEKGERRAGRGGRVQKMTG